MSIPTRGSWIEILRSLSKELREQGRSPHGGRGLKYDLFLLYQS